MTKRVYHPTLDSYQDVPDGNVDDWVEAGWKKNRPEHVRGDLPEVGSHPGIAAVPVLEDVSRTTTSSTGARTGTRSTGGSGRASSGSRTAGGSTTGRGATSAAATSGGTSAGSTT